MKDKSWSLGDAIKLIEGVSHKFSKPSRDAIEPLEKGHKVKLTFNYKSDNAEITNTEQLWVEILLVQDNKYLGQLEDNPERIEDLKCGEIIEFEKRHIIDID